MNTLSASPSMKLNPGSYWISDPCYAYPKYKWSDFCRGYTEQSTIATENDYFFFVWTTAHGDGIYEVRGPKSGICSVDSGVLSIIPEELIRLWGTEDKLKEMSSRGHVMLIEMKTEFEVKEKDGDVKFGKYRITTS